MLFIPLIMENCKTTFSEFLVIFNNLVFLFVYKLQYKISVYFEIKNEKISKLIKEIPTQEFCFY